MIKTFEQFVSDKYGEHISKNLNNDNIIGESLVSTAVATSIMMRRSKSGSSSSSYYDDEEEDNHSKGAKIINAAIKIIFSAGGILLMNIPAVIGLAGLIILFLGLVGNFKNFIDTKILKNNINESLINDELLTEGKLKDFFEEKIVNAVMKNEKLKAICEEIMKRDDFKEAQNENSIKKLVKCVVSYFKENKNKEKEFTQLQSELKEEK